ncbi:hypothetical protein GUITHDRAFT_102672 [Guillardia theta CCMP2712]|uniref:Sfi1 spindle body domain-containing protein n=1 Tax=Guillardia theta (strain CCMP2712) TaxID=905079 RepID=L1JSI6_GUITC|nr:hypothetical protein GUITHDRAFT_102672 [Guillardia theta CCMP2712]EKX51402.1 hypothetical protein GUITHDRAFT_102672 [Guillardia theta CCMP2712]|eukprot:XP_005838382.1 hypothetical protein GUITHDRAFT_102672 [Guillardia theta CCMP2712]
MREKMLEDVEENFLPCAKHDVNNKTTCDQLAVYANSWALRKFLEYENVLSFRQKWAERHRERLFVRLTLQGWRAISRSRLARTNGRSRRRARAESSGEDEFDPDGDEPQVNEAFARLRWSTCQKSLAQCQQKLFRTLEIRLRTRRLQLPLQEWRRLRIRSSKLQQVEQQVTRSRWKGAAQFALREWKARTQDAHKSVVVVERTFDVAEQSCSTTGYVKDLMEVEERCHNIQKVQQHVKQLQDSISKSRSLRLQEAPTTSPFPNPGGTEECSMTLLLDERCLVDPFQPDRSSCSAFSSQGFQSCAAVARSKELLAFVPSRREKPRGLPAGIDLLLE